MPIRGPVALIRALVACGWFGVQTLFGGIAIHLLFSAISDDWATLGGTGEVIGFFIFWVANVTVVIRGSESIKHLEALAAPLLLVVAIGLAFWAYPKVSISEILATPGRRACVQVPHGSIDCHGGILGDFVAQYS
jgi:NCS1 family nucleobase:cation symporter-1